MKAFHSTHRITNHWYVYNDAEICNNIVAQMISSFPDEWDTVELLDSDNIAEITDIIEYIKTEQFADTCHLSLHNIGINMAFSAISSSLRRVSMTPAIVASILVAAIECVDAPKPIGKLVTIAKIVKAIINPNMPAFEVEKCIQIVETIAPTIDPTITQSQIDNVVTDIITIALKLHPVESSDDTKPVDNIMISQICNSQLIITPHPRSEPIPRGWGANVAQAVLVNSGVPRGSTFPPLD